MSSPISVLSEAKELLKRIAAFSSLSIFYSLLALIGPRETHPPFSMEATFGIEEFSAHFLFGVIAAIPALDWRLAAYCGIFAVAIDLDHLPVALGLQVVGRPDHSFTFIALAGILMGLAFRSRGRFDRPLMLTTFAAALSHIAYDLYEASRLDFPLLLPLYSEQFTLSRGDWLPLQLAAIGFSALTHLGRRGQFQKASLSILPGVWRWRPRKEPT